MNFFLRLKLLPHEWFFGGFLVIQWLRLCCAAGPQDADALLYAVTILASGLTVACCLRWQTRLWWWARLWLPVVAMNVVFTNMKTSVLKVTPQKFDGVLAGFDRALCGTTLSGQAAEIATPWLTEVLSFCYLLFFPYLLISLCYYAYRGIPMMRRLMAGLFTIYGIGFLGYSLVPAGGPYLAFPEEFGVPLTGWAVTKFNAWVVANGSNGVDVFPSLHCAVSCYLLFFDKRHSPWRFRLYLIPCFGIWAATIYLRYHYALDLIAGFSLAAFALWLTKGWAKNDSLHSTLLS